MDEFKENEINFIRECYPYLIYKRMSLQGETAIFNERISDGYNYLLRSITLVQSETYTNVNTCNSASVQVEIRSLIHNLSRVKGNQYNFQGSNFRIHEMMIAANLLSTQHNPAVKNVFDVNRKAGTMPAVTSIPADGAAFTHQVGTRKFLNYVFLHGENFEIKFKTNPLESSFDQNLNYGSGTKTLNFDVLLNGYYIPRQRE